MNKQSESFESWLQDYHCENNPCILDDELGDAFDEWACELEIEEWIRLGQLYADSRTEERKEVDWKAMELCLALDWHFDNEHKGFKKFIKALKDKYVIYERKQ